MADNNPAPGWELDTSQIASGDESRYYTATNLINRKDGATSKLRTRINIDTGAYQVYNTTSFGDALLYTYNPNTNTTTIAEKGTPAYNLYQDLFSGKNVKGGDQVSQLNNLNRSVKTALLNISAADATTNEADEASNNRIRNLPGYKSLAQNTADVQPQSKEDGSQPTQPDGVQPPNQEPSEQEPGLTEEPGDANNVGGFNPNEVPINSDVGAVYRYPLEVPDLGYDFIKITAFEYVASGLDFGPDRQSASERLFKNALETIVLPMQPNLSESNNVSWGEDRLDAIKAAFGKLSADTITSLGELIGGGAAAGIQQAGTDFLGRANQLIKDKGSASFLAAYFAGQAVGANITARTTGSVINPNLELLFTGPNLRSFSFNFKLTPRSKEESNEIKKIIRAFKRNMAVQRSTSSLFLLTPNVFKLEYIYNGGGQHPFLNKFKPCALTSFNVNYTPDGSYMTYGEDGSMTSYSISMTFGELEPIYADEHSGSDDMSF